MSRELKIDPEFRDLISRLQAEEYAGLKKSLINEGCRDKIITWQDIVIDGHNRFEICNSLDIPYETTEMDFNDRDEAMKWMIDNQFSRRNLTDEQKAYLIGKQYLQEVKSVGAPKGHAGVNQHTIANVAKDTTLAPIRTVEKIAEERNVSTKTVQNSSKYASAVDSIYEVLPEAKEKILSGNLSASKSDIVEVSKQAPEKIVKIMTMAFGGKKVSEVLKGKENQEQDETPTKPKSITININKKYQVIYVCPRWKGHILEYKANELHNAKKLCDMKIPSHKNCVLFMWCPADRLGDAFVVISAWGFKYKTSLVWVYSSSNYDSYFRQKHDLLIVATKGDIETPSTADKLPSVIRAKNEMDNWKPEIVIEQIEKWYPKHKKLAMFSIGTGEGWDKWDDNYYKQI
ncbi:MAG: hypothetical protein HQK96_09715 [Nitrospirae bacterium]|nr:hypothetical protein [Nitrospirota bacterium]MBF0554813.1 hypothetical protein [Nitrospirota bacterium]